VPDAPLNVYKITKGNDGKALVVGKYYGIRVACQNDIGVSEWSPILKAVAAGKPGLPTSLARKTETTNTEIYVSWVAPTTTGGLAIVDYHIFADQG